MQTNQDSLRELEKDQGPVRRWITEVKLAEKYPENWKKRTDEVVGRYRDERAPASKSPLRYNVLWANTSILEPAVYNGVPKSIIERRFKDRDPVGRLASRLLQRCSQFSIDDYDFDYNCRLFRKDFLLCGQGVGRIYYYKTEGEVLKDGSGEVVYADQKEARPLREILSERVRLEYVHRHDFLRSPARTWEETRYVMFLSYMTLDELNKRFGRKFTEKSKLLDYAPTMEQKMFKDNPEEFQLFKRAKIYEIWDKETKTVKWLSKAYDKDFLDEQKDPLGLKGFFPCPRPMLSNTTTDSLLGYPDYLQYQDQAVQLDVLAGRIEHLTACLRVAGVRNASVEGLEQVLTQSSGDGKLVPVSDWQTFMEKGGLEGAVQFLPLEEVASTLMQLYQQFDAKKAEIDELEGISDIVRGNTAASETATAQELKSKYVNLRLQEKKGEMDRFLRDGIALMTEVIAEQFDESTISEMSGLNPQNTDDPDLQANWQGAIALIRDDVLRNFKIEIETDQTGGINQAQEKEQAMEFLNAVGAFSDRAAQSSQFEPNMKPALLNTLLWGLRKFNVARDLEPFYEQMVEQAMQPPPEDQAPDPEMLKVQSEVELNTAKAESERGAIQVRATELQLRDKEINLEFERVKIEAQKLQNVAQEIAVKNKQVDAELAIRKAELDAQVQLKLAAMAMDKEIAAMKVTADLKQGELDREASRADKLESETKESAREASQASQSNKPIELTINMNKGNQKIKIDPYKSDGSREASIINEQA